MAPATQLAGNCGDVDFALAAKAQADAPPGQLSQKHGSFNAGDADGVVHDALAVLFGG
jgi:hypothetical protein